MTTISISKHLREQSRERRWHPTPVLLPGKSHGCRSLVGCSPLGHEESDMTEWLHFHFDALEKEMATHSSFLAWRISGTEEPGGLPSIGLHRVGQDWSDLAAREQSCVGIGEVCLESQKLHKPLGLTLQYEEKGRVRDGYVASLSQWTWIWANSRDSEGQGNLAFFSPGGCKQSDMT